MAETLDRAARQVHILVMNTQLLSQARQLSVQDQLDLMEALWDGIVERDAAPGPTQAQKTELDRRLAEHASNPDNVVPWSEVKASARNHIRP